MAQELAGLTAVITGSASGIGLATAEMFHEQGVTVFGFDLNRGELPEGIHWIQCDITSPKAVDAAFREVEAASKVLDIVVNCAGKWSYDRN